MKKLITFLLFASNLLLAITFGLDVMDYYFHTGLNIINNNINREFTMWFGFIISMSSCLFFIDETQKK